MATPTDSLDDHVMAHSPVTVASPDAPTPPLLGGASGARGSRRRRRKFDELKSPKGSESARGRRPRWDEEDAYEDNLPHTARGAKATPRGRLRPHASRRYADRPKISKGGFGSIYRGSDAPGPGAYDTEGAVRAVERHSSGATMPGRASERSSFIGQAMARGRETPGPGAHDSVHAFGAQNAITASKPTRRSRYHAGNTAPSFTFGSAPTDRGATRDVGYATPRHDMKTTGGHGRVRKEGEMADAAMRMTHLARAGSNLARAVFISKQHARENLGAHSPGPARYSPKSSFKSQVGVTADAGRMKSTPSFHFGTSGRF